MHKIKELNKAVVFIIGVTIGLVIGILFITKYKKSDCVIDINADAEEQKEIWVDVQGAVNEPGVYKLTKTFRVGEALSLAGGISSSASSKWFSQNINLSKLVEDGDKIYIPFEYEIYKSEEGYLLPLFFEKAENTESQVVSSGSTDSSSSGESEAGGLINVNSAAVEDLDALSGIGPAYAQKIEDNRPYSDFSDLVENSGVPESTLKKIKDHITF